MYKEVSAVVMQVFGEQKSGGWVFDWFGFRVYFLGSGRDQNYRHHYSEVNILTTYREN